MNFRQFASAGAIGLGIVVLSTTAVRSQSRNRGDSSLFYLEKGGVELKQNKYEDAESSFKRALIFDSTRFNAWSALGYIYTALGKYDAAITHLERARTLEPTNKDALINLGAVYKEKNNYDRAIEIFRTALEVDTTSLMVRKSLGASFLSAGQFDSATTHLLIVTAKFPEDGEAHYLLGNSYSGLKKYADATPCYKMAIDKKFTPAMTHINYGIAAEATMDVWTAEEQYGQAIRIAPDSLSYRQRLAALMVKTGHYPEAIALFEENLKRNPKFVSARVGIGATFSFMGRMNEANAELEKVRASHPGLVALMQKMIADGQAFRRFDDSLKKAEAMKPAPTITSPPKTPRDSSRR